MKKLLEKDIKTRLKIFNVEKNSFILTSIFKNLNFLSLVRWNAFNKLKKLKKRKSPTSLSNRCLASFNKKRFNKMTNFSRNIFLKLLRSGQIYGFKKSSW